METKEFVFETKAVLRTHKTYELILFTDKADGRSEQDAFNAFLKTKVYQTDWYKVEYLEEECTSYGKETLVDYYED
jgi:hypothetical protein